MKLTHAVTTHFRLKKKSLGPTPLLNFPPSPWFFFYDGFVFPSGSGDPSTISKMSTTPARPGDGLITPPLLTTGSGSGTFPYPEEVTLEGVPPIPFPRLQVPGTQLALNDLHTLPTRVPVMLLHVIAQGADAWCHQLWTLPCFPNFNLTPGG